MPITDPPLGEGWWPTGRSLAVLVGVTLGVGVLAGVGFGVGGGMSGPETVGLAAGLAGITWTILGNLRSLRRASNSTRPVLDRKRDLRQLRGKEPYDETEVPRLRLAADHWGRQTAGGTVSLPGMVVYILTRGFGDYSWWILVPFVAALVALGVCVPMLIGDLRVARRFLASTAEAPLSR